jgi:hypothetical protein
MTAIVQSIPLTILFESQCVQGFYSVIAQRRSSCGGAFPPFFRPAFDRLTQAKHQRFVICQFDLTEAEKYVPNEFATKSEYSSRRRPLVRRDGESPQARVCLRLPHVGVIGSRCFCQNFANSSPDTLDTMPESVGCYESFFRSRLSAANLRIKARL